MCHLLLFWTEAEDIHFLTQPEGRKKFSSFPLDFFALVYFSPSVAFIT